MAQDENWSLMVLQLAAQPLKLLRPDVRGILLGDILRHFVAVEHNQSQLVDVEGIVPGLHPPRVEDLRCGVAAVGVVISQHVQSLPVSRVERVDHRAVLLGRDGKVAQLNDRIRRWILHGCEDCVQTRGAIVHHVLMQVSNQAKPNRLRKPTHIGFGGRRKRQGSGRGCDGLEKSAPVQVFLVGHGSRFMV